MIRAMLLTVAALPLAADAAAAQQYREGVPGVMTPPPPRAAPGTYAIADFQAAYAKRARPRFILFWNRTLSDEVQSEYVGRVAGSSSSRSAGVAAAGRRSAVVAGAGESSFAVEAGVTRVREAGRESMHEGDDWRVEEGFNQAFIENGAKFVDRNLAMRGTAHGQKLGAMPNVQDIEMSALRGKADLLMEVLQTPDSEAEFGYRFRVNVKDVRTGEMLATVTSDGRGPPPPPGRFVAVSTGGFARQAPPAPRIEDAGRQLAIETMRALSAKWR